MTSSPLLYRLSGLLESHMNDVRALASDPHSSLFSTSRDKTAKRWTRHSATDDQSGGWQLESTYTCSEWINSTAHLASLTDSSHPGEPGCATPHSTSR